MARTSVALPYCGRERRFGRRKRDFLSIIYRRIQHESID
jgi:hypothetical protein